MKSLTIRQLKRAIDVMSRRKKLKNVPFVISSGLTKALVYMQNSVQGQPEPQDPRELLQAAGYKWWQTTIETNTIFGLFRVCNSAARVPALQTGGRRFESCHAHQLLRICCHACGQWVRAKNVTSQRTNMDVVIPWKWEAFRFITQERKEMFYEFRQNNSGGSLVDNLLAVIVEADSAAEANSIAEDRTPVY